jgi:uncharacterized protein YcfJ
MSPSTMPPLVASTTDEDLAAQARPGYGVPSQDPRPEAQAPLVGKEAEREAESVLVGGGMMAGAATGAAIGVAVAGPVGVVVGGTLGAVAGAVGGAAAGTVIDTDGLRDAGATTETAPATPWTDSKA